MNNIIRIITSDFKRLAPNVVAMVMIMGLSILPSLYAWFNILSNWDPYGEDSTKNLHVAVASDDVGIDFDGAVLNIGGIIVDNLKQNTTIGWVFTDTSEEAIDGVYAGDYYACLVIDEDFSENMISFLGGKPEHPVISYYENEKKNAIAPKITGKVKTTVQQEVDNAFVGTMAQVLVVAGEYVSGTSATSENTFTENTLERMHSLDDDLTTAITILDSYIALMDSAKNLIDTTEEMTDELDSMMDTSRQMLNAAESAANTASDSADAVSEIVDASFKNMEMQLRYLQQSVDALFSSLNVNYVEKMAASIVTSVQNQKASFDGFAADAPGGNAWVTSYGEEVTAVDNAYSTLIRDLSNLQTAANKTDYDAAAEKIVIQRDIDACIAALSTVSSEYSTKVRPQVKTTVSSIRTSINEVESLLNYTSDAIDDVADILATYPNALNMGQGNLQESRDAVADMQKMLRDLIADVEELEGNDQYRALTKLIENDPELVADMISEPIELNQQAVYPIENNGSATAPFYVILSIWFGALITVVIVKTKVMPIEGIEKMKNYQAYFGRYVTTFLIGQTQVLITVFGCLFYVGIQCKHTFLFWLACSITSFAFTFFLYSLVYALGSVGEAAAVILLVIQVAGAGGTFPVEVLPKIFQYLYGYMPFAYGMNALRECIGGMHGWDYGNYLSGLAIYIGVSLILGLVVAVPYKKLGNIMEEALEKTGCM